MEGQRLLGNKGLARTNKGGSSSQIKCVQSVTMKPLTLYVNFKNKQNSFKERLTQIKPDKRSCGIS